MARQSTIHVTLDGGGDDFDNIVTELDSASLKLDMSLLKYADYLDSLASALQSRARLARDEAE